MIYDIKEFLKFAPGYVIVAWIAYKAVIAVLNYYRGKNKNKINENGNFKKEIITALNRAVDSRGDIVKMIRDHDMASVKEFREQTSLLEREMNKQNSLLSEISGSMKTIIEIFRKS